MLGAAWKANPTLWAPPTFRHVGLAQETALAAASQNSVFCSSLHSASWLHSAVGLGAGAPHTASQAAAHWKRRHQGVRSLAAKMCEF